MPIQEINPIENRILQYKNHIHTNPEISWQEIGTTAYIKEQLGATSLIEGVGENGTGALFTVGDGSTNIFVRADIDALRTSEGPQHLCGHSTHTAALMGAYHWLREHEQQLTAQNKKVAFIFQPAEEMYPFGAHSLLDAYPQIFADASYGFGIHVAPHLPIGTVEMQDGTILAANDIVEVEIRGFTAHLRNVLNGVDAIDGAAQVVRLFRDFQKTFDTFGTEVVFNFNKIQGGVASNCVADRVTLKGGVRWFNKADQQRVKDFLDGLPDALKQTFSGSVVVRYTENIPPPCVNDSELAEEVATYFQDHSALKVIRTGQKDLGSEDFAYYSQAVKTLFSWVGVDCPYSLHDPRMKVSDEATLQVYQYWKDLLQWWIDK